MDNNINNNENENTINNGLDKISFSVKEKEEMEIKINKLSFESKKEILMIVIKNNEKYSENNNGTMFDLVGLKIKTLNDINKFLIYTEENTKEVERTEQEVNNYKDDLQDEN